MKMKIGALFVGLASLSAGAQARPGPDAVTARDLWVEPPTLQAIGLEWRIEGDGNRNASVEVEYREAGQGAWLPAMPLVRSQGEKVGNLVPPRANFHPDPNRYVNPNMFAGSIFGLLPDTRYQVRLKLADPDGVRGGGSRTVEVRTRAEPMPAPGGKVYHVYPIGWTGPKQEPAFTGLMEAYYEGAASSDFQGTFPPRVKPGDTVLVHAGTYQSDRVHYLNGLPHPGYNALSTLFDGTYYLTASGTADKPIAIKAAGDGEVIFDGNGAQTFFNLMAANYNYFEGITFRNANLVFLLGLKNIAGASGFTLKHSRLYDIGRGVQDDWSGSKNFYIADNEFIGRHDPKKMMGWRGAEWEKLPGFPEKLGGPEGSEYAIKLYGQGHVVAHNYIAHWHDGVDIATYGDPDQDANGLEKRDRVPVSIDFHGNDFFNMSDNCIETDGGAHNIRVYDNRCFNSISGALSATPLLGGPVYFVRNLVYNTTTEGVMKVGTAANVLLLQNTFVGEVATDAPNQVWMNNLVLGVNPKAPLLRMNSYSNHSQADHNAYGFNPQAAVAYEWNTPPFEVGMDWSKPTVKRAFKSLADMQAATGQERHSFAAGYADLVKVSMPDRPDVQRLYAPADYDFSPAAGSPLVDAGARLPTINDGFQGKAPDIGALEAGAAPRLYGPRPWHRDAGS
ncbi:hypothetical protein GT347_26725 [Xylophilus rhododendri]|uniref:Right handed beta helix domain-containing protein n=1 Tax=Xylophilus rhododendri TaxID=2697032 RepID=A0A857JBF1_9BURK|nr:hypothetical protein [Xylophilus rhododendri]QHJ01267.1 hypothetical protein GT347_26725 [Xylophilus rhododendri]